MISKTVIIEYIMSLGGGGLFAKFPFFLSQRHRPMHILANTVK